MVDGLQFFLQYGLGDGYVFEGDGAFAIASVDHLSVDDFVYEGVDAVLCVFGQ